MDILGYKELVKSADSDTAYAITLITNLKDMINNCICEEFNRHPSILDSKVDYTLFSDSLCLSIPIEELKDDEITLENMYSHPILVNNMMRLFLLCRLISNIQLYSLEYGIIYRGAISVGNHYKDEHVMFSKALVDCYLAESTEAIYPRVILLFNDFLRYVPLCHQYYSLDVIEDEDFMVVDYLNRIIEFRGSEWMHTLMNTHKTFIEKNILKFKDNESLLKKYYWMMNYHHLKLGSTFDMDKFGIDNVYRDICREKFGLNTYDLFGSFEL